MKIELKLKLKLKSDIFLKKQSCILNKNIMILDQILLETTFTVYNLLLN